MNADWEPGPGTTARGPSKVPGDREIVKPRLCSILENKQKAGFGILDIK